MPRRSARADGESTVTGLFAGFRADLRDSMKGDDPLVDLRTLPPEILQPIQPWVDDYLAARRPERRVQLFGVQFTMCPRPRGPTVRYSELTAVYTKFTELSAASERA